MRMKSLLSALADDTLACALCILALAVLAVGLGGLWHTGTTAALTICACGALLAYLLVWLRVPPGLSPLIAQGIGAAACVRVVASVPLPSSGPLAALEPSDGLTTTGWLAHALGHAVGPQRVVFLLLLFLLWEVAYTVVWLVLRERWAWAAVALAGAALVAATGAASAVGRQVVVFALVALALVVWTTATDAAATWRRDGVAVARGTRWPGVAAGALMLALAGLGAWTWAPPSYAAAGAGVPSVPTGLLPAMADLLRGIVARGPAPAGALSSTGALGQGGPLRLDQPFAPTGAQAAEVSGPIPLSGAATYWRGAVYDIYQDGVWSLGAARSQMVPANTPLQSAGAGEDGLTLHYHLFGAPPGAALISAGRPLRLSVPVQASLNAGGLLAVSLSGAVGTAPDYDATSTWLAPGQTSVPGGAVVADLSLPPAWGDVVALARRVTRGAATPAARVTALEAYLRGHYTYDPRVGGPPAGQDPVRYFLFTSQHGYCNHFAAALALMARGLGLPARLVGGYVGGEEGPAHASVVLHDSDAHTWPEVYLPDRGWTSYEPTPGFGRSTPSTAPAGSPGLPATTPPRVTSTPAAPVAPAGGPPAAPIPGAVAPPVGLLPLGLILLAGLLFLLRRQRRHATPAAQTAALYGRMCRVLAPVRLAPRGGETPREHARRVGALDPRVAEGVLSLTTLYEGVSYARASPSQQDLARARASLRGLRRLCWLRRLGLRRASVGAHASAA